MEEIAANVCRCAEKLQKCWTIEIRVCQNGENSLCNDLSVDMGQRAVRWLRNTRWVDETEFGRILSVEFRENRESMTAVFAILDGWVQIKGIK